MSTSWTPETPTEPGYYWFYGWAHEKPRKQEPRHRTAPLGLEFYKVHVPRLSLVRVRQYGNQNLMFVAEGAFVYPNHMRGLWTPADLPDLPRHCSLPQE